MNILFLFSILVEQVRGQPCNGMAQYDQCSSNSGCECLHITGTANGGICSVPSFLECSQLILCDTSTNHCYQPGHKCVHHPRCHTDPICVPIESYNEQLCPPKPGNRI